MKSNQHKGLLTFQMPDVEIRRMESPKLCITICESQSKVN